MRKRIFVITLMIFISSISMLNAQYLIYLREYRSDRLAIVGDEIWIAGMKGLISYNKTTGKTVNHNSAINVTSKDTVSCIEADISGDIYFYKKHDNLYKYSPYKECKNILNWEENAYYSNFNVLIQDKETGDLWLGGSNELYRIKNSGTYTLITNKVSSNYSVVTDMDIDNNKTLWGVCEAGSEPPLFYCNTQSLRSNFRSLKEDLIPKNIIDYIYSVEIDDSGEIWFCASDGICRYLKDEKSYVVYNNDNTSGIMPKKDYTDADIDFEITVDIYYSASDKDSDGNLWFSSPYHLTKYNGTEFKSYTCPEYKEARDIICDEDIVWVYLRDDSLLKFQNGEFTQVELNIIPLNMEESIAKANKTKAYIANGVLNIENEGGITSIEVYNSLGTPLYLRGAGGEETSIQIQLSSTIKGIIIVKVNNEVVKVICN